MQNRKIERIEKIGERKERGREKMNGHSKNREDSREEKREGRTVQKKDCYSLLLSLRSSRSVGICLSFDSEQLVRHTIDAIPSSLEERDRTFRTSLRGHSSK